MPKYPNIPATLIGRLAVHIDHQNKKLGKFLLINALFRSWQSSETVGSAIIIVEVKDTNAFGFYKNYGFTEFEHTPNKLFLPMATIRELFI